jgi:hypothetical protein
VGGRSCPLKGGRYINPWHHARLHVVNPSAVAVVANGIPSASISLWHDGDAASEGSAVRPVFSFIGARIAMRSFPRRQVCLPETRLTYPPPPRHLPCRLKNERSTVRSSGRYLAHFSVRVSRVVRTPQIQGAEFPHRLIKTTVRRFSGCPVLRILKGGRPCFSPPCIHSKEIFGAPAVFSPYW